jgi:hypothetical protein
LIVQEEWVSIATTPDVVERHLIDRALMAKWRSPLVQLDPIEGDLMAMGSVHRMQLNSLALAGADYRVTERDSSHILMTISGIWEGTELWRWFSDGPRVVVQNRVEYEVPNAGLRFFAVGIGRFVADLDMRVQLFRLRELIEGPPSLDDTTRAPQRIVIEE